MGIDASVNGTMAAGDYFAASFAEARRQFHEACRSLDIEPVALGVTPGMFGGPGGGLVEIVRLGDAAAANVLVLCAGDRLADALCCSGVQVGWLSEYAARGLPDGSALVIMHHGAAPASGGELPPRNQEIPQWDSDVLAKVEERYAEYAREKGIDHTGAPLPDQLPGDAAVPGYATEILDGAYAQLAGGGEGRILLLEIGVGLGPFGRAEITPCHAGSSSAAQRVRSWFQLDEPPAQSAPPGHRPDHLAAGLMRRLPSERTYAAGVSFGTYSMISVLDTLARRDGNTSIPDTKQLLYPASGDWHAAVWQDAAMVLQRALSALQDVQK